MHKIVGGFLVQQRDLQALTSPRRKIVSNRPPTSEEMADLKVAWLACKHVKSNAIVLAKGGMVVGVGGGQVDRVGAARIAIAKGGQPRCGERRCIRCVFPISRRTETSC